MTMDEQPGIQSETPMLILSSPFSWAQHSLSEWRYLLILCSYVQLSLLYCWWLMLSKSLSFWKTAIDNCPQGLQNGKTNDQWLTDDWGWKWLTDRKRWEKRQIRTTMHPLATTRDDGRNSSGRSENDIRHSSIYALFIKPDDRIPACFRVGSSTVLAIWFQTSFAWLHSPQVSFWNFFLHLSIRRPFLWLDWL